MGPSVFCLGGACETEWVHFSIFVSSSGLCWLVVLDVDYFGIFQSLCSISCLASYCIYTLVVSFDLISFGYSKHSFILWLTIHNRLFTRMRLREWDTFDVTLPFLWWPPWRSHSPFYKYSFFFTVVWFFIRRKCYVDLNSPSWSFIILELIVRCRGHVFPSVGTRIALGCSFYGFGICTPLFF